jgi:RNA polymerase sigma-70 factor (ECF subfamily)
VTRHLIIDRWRREVRWEKRVQVLHRDLDRPSSISETVEEVLGALDRLSSDHRAVLLLRYADGCSSREIADMLDRSPRAIDSLIARARAALIEACAVPAPADQPVLEAV